MNYTDKNNITDKFKSNKGIAMLVVILLIADLILAVIIAVPVLNYIKEQERIQQDYGHVEVAKDSAYMAYVADGSFEAVYDAIHKKFVDVKDIRKVEAYGNSKEHQGMVIVVKADEDGNVEATWVDPRRYDKK